LTDRNERGRKDGYKSLYLGLLYTIVVGLCLGVVVYFLIFLPSSYIINNYYVKAQHSEARRGEYLESLQSYVASTQLSLENSDQIAAWVRSNPYVYLLVYESQNQESFIGGEAVAPGAKDKLSELSGPGIDDSISRDDLIADARQGGYRLINLSDGYVIVALAEYSENLYLTIFRGVSLLMAAITFVFMLVRYIGRLIARIKRFASDVTIVSELDMNYEIVSEGRDEIALLSGDVEKMRRSMLSHIESEKEARAANSELITSISHDIRTPLTVLMGYIEMMRERESDEVMLGYIDATESTAMRLKQLSDDMFKYLLAFGDADGNVTLEDYDANMLLDQLLAEHILLLRETGYNIIVNNRGEALPDGSLVRTDAQNLMRIFDNLFSNVRKYADPEHPIYIDTLHSGGRLTLEMRNRVKADTSSAESSKIGLKTCQRLGSLVADGFEYESVGDDFVCRLNMKIKESV
jgi:signal transduction histidine kinase